jgi:hypothetical protein
LSQKCIVCPHQPAAAGLPSWLCSNRQEEESALLISKVSELRKTEKQDSVKYGHEGGGNLGHYSFYLPCFDIVFW